MSVTERIEPRPLVPSEREVAVGVRAESVEAIERPTAPERRSAADALRAYGRDMDPRTFTAGRSMKPLLIMSLAGLLVGLYDQTFGLILPEMRADFAFDVQFLFTIGALATVVSLTAAPLVGYLIDRTKRVRLFRIGLLIAGVSSLMTGVATGLPGLIGGRLGFGAGRAISDPATFPLLADSYPPSSRARVFSFAWMAGISALVLGPIAGGGIAIAFGWRAAVVAISSLTIGASVLALFLKEPVRGYEDRIANGAGDEVAAIEQAPVSWREGWRALRSVTTVRRLWYATPFLQLAGSALLPTLSFYYSVEFGLSLQARAAIVVMNGAVSIVALLISGPVADRLMAFRPGRVMTLMGLGLVLQSAVIIVFAVSPSPWISVGVSIPLAFVNNLFAPALFVLMTMTIPARVRGFGLTTIAPWQLMAVVALPFLGHLADRVGIRHAMYLFVPLYLTGAAILGTASSGVDRDIRAAQAANLAEEEARKARAAGRTKMLVCRDVDVTYDGVRVLFGVDFDVDEGEIVALLGTNGAGKSTLLRAISGVQEASNGAIFFDGNDITHVPPNEIAARGAIMVPGGRAIFPSLTVEENLRTATLLDARAAGGTEEVLGFFPALRTRFNEQAGNLSGGEQQMLALAQAFLMKPKLLMIDELSLGLAPSVVEQLLVILRAIHANGTTIILVEQSVNLALTLAERAVFMEKGEVVFMGSTEELLHRSDVMRSVFLGSARATGVATPTRRTLAARAAEETGAMLAVTDLWVRFGGVAALQGAHVEVKRREIVGIIGPNGAGKTTLFDAISGFVPTQQGRVTLEGADVTLLGPDRRARLGLGRSFQNARLFSTLTARETIAVAMERHLDAENVFAAAVWSPNVRRLEKRTWQRVDSLIDLLGLGAYADKFVSELSTATRRIVDIGCVMASQPNVLLLDEPSSGLAQAETEELGPLLERLVKETGCGLLVIEHDIPMVTAIAHRLVAMDLGAVLVEGESSDVIAHPEVVRAYLGGSEEVIARSGRIETKR